MSVILHTSVGDLEFQLHCQTCPRASFNFLALCASGYYDNTLLHRNVPNFIIQGGDPTGTGKGGESIFRRFRQQQLGDAVLSTSAGAAVTATASRTPPAATISGYFDDEGFGEVSHSERGVLSMAHKGNKPNTNASQFFICYTPQRSFDGVYTAFGRLVKGFDTLAILEAAGGKEGGGAAGGQGSGATEEQRPRVLRTTVTSNPFAAQQMRFDPRSA